MQYSECTNSVLIVSIRVILITIEMGIGVLSLPKSLSTLGLIPGIIAIFGFGILTTYCGYILAQFYRRYPMVTNLVDCAYYVGGKPFEIFFSGAFILNLILIAASANITMSIALNTLSNHALCTVGFIGIPHIGEHFQVPRSSYWEMLTLLSQLAGSSASLESSASLQPCPGSAPSPSSHPS